MEYATHARANLEPFYNSVGLKVIYRPIADFGIPEQLDINEDIDLPNFYAPFFDTCS